MTTRQKLDALIDETANRYFHGMTPDQRDFTAIDTTLSGLRALAKATDRLNRRLDTVGERLDTIDKRLASLEQSTSAKRTLDDLGPGGRGLLRSRLRKMGKKKKK